MMTSDQLEEFLWKHGTKKVIANLAKTIFKGGPFFDGLMPPKSLLEECDVETIMYRGSKIYSICRKNIVYTDTIFYLHGGGFCCGLSKIQWDFITFLSKSLPYQIVVPDYPLVPHVTYSEIYDFISEIYKFISDTKGRIFVIGDSAGASLVLGLSQIIDKKSFRKPNHQILISPWMDIELTNSEIDIIDPIDPTLDRNGLKIIEQLYSAGNTKNSLVSPIYGNYKESAPMSLFIGTRDILYPDCNLFYKKCLLEDIDIKYYEYKDMIHIFPLFNTSQGNEAKEIIIKTIV